MKAPPKNYSLLADGKRFRIPYTYQSLIVFLLLVSLPAGAQIANYVNNPSFEEITPTATVNPFAGAAYWGPINSTAYSYMLLSSLPPLNSAPYSSYGFQFPRSGNNFIISDFYCTCLLRGYPRNKLKGSLSAGKTYCAKLHVVNTNNNLVAIENYQMYFGDSMLDTITKCDIPLVYLSPQISNTFGIVTDTLNWIPIIGTFVATGSEKYLMLGNFKSNAATNTLLINSPTLTTMSNDIYIDDVSVVDLDLPAYAGQDASVALGDSAFLGRQPDVGIDEACQWYRLPNTATPIATVAGLWVKPVVTTTYVVRQQLWCSGPKWDSVVVHMNLVGLAKLKMLNDELGVFPQPALDFIELKIFNPQFFAEFRTFVVYNNLGWLIKEEELSFKDNSAKINISDLSPGIYSLQLRNKNSETITRRFVIAR
ncbi:MAG: T9SS type A sorting domain-containing protein [bacterium]|nr:T9SS type A sorting domain-containing protein [bacterium]